MNVAFALRLDSAVASAVVRLQTCLAHAVGSEVDADYGPHITLAVMSRRGIPKRIEEAVFAEGNNWPRLPLVLTGIGIFPGEVPTVFAVPAVTGELIDVHRKLLAILGSVEVHPHHRPKSWTPHVTLTQETPSTRLIEAALAAWPGHIQVETIWLDFVQFPPFKLLRSAALC